jgi:glycosyltransferase involved in cell wall biosynthesis
MKKYVPSALKYPLIFLYVAWRSLARGGGDTSRIVLNLAGVLPEDRKAIVHGGKVKLLHLRERFGDSWKRFNIAYFVSSGLPFAPRIWMKVYKFFGVRVVWNQNGFAYPALYPAEVVERINGVIAPIHQADFVVFQTEFTKRCTDKFVGAYNGPSEVLVNPVDTEKFAPTAVELPPEPFVIIMAGNHFESPERMKVSLAAVRLAREKGLNAKLLVTGKVDEAMPREDWIETSGSFLQAEAPALYQKAHMLLHLKYLDPCPTNVLEAFATGLPVVGQANGGLPEMVPREAGILLPSPEDFAHLHYPAPEAVADAILAVKENLRAYSRAARASSLKFDKKAWVARHEKIFDNLLHGS